jgi:hypothetical protein
MSPEINQALSDALFNTLIPLLVTLLLGLATLISTKFNFWLSSKLSKEQMDFARNLAKTAVQAAEQSGVAKIIVNTAEEKKNYALNFMERSLDSMGMKHLSKNIGLLGSLIEAEINQQSHKIPTFYAEELLPGQTMAQATVVSQES